MSSVVADDGAGALPAALSLGKLAFTALQAVWYRSSRHCPAQAGTGQCFPVLHVCCANRQKTRAIRLWCTPL